MKASIDSITAKVEDENIVSQKVLVKSGFKNAFKKGAEGYIYIKKIKWLENYGLFNKT